MGELDELKYRYPQILFGNYKEIQQQQQKKLLIHTTTDTVPENSAE